MAQPDDLEARVSALESEVRDLSMRVRGSEQDAAAARILAGGADRDVGELRDELRDFRVHNTRVLSAMREDLTDLRATVETGFAEVREHFDGVDRGFAEVRGRLDGAAAGQEQIVTLLTRLIDAPDDTGDQP